MKFGGEKMLKIIKISLPLIWFSGIVYLLISSLIENRFLEEYIYWLVLIGLIFFIWLWKRNSKFSLYSSFTLFLISALIVTFGFKDIGEFIMRLSFIFLLVGYIQSLVEYKRE